MYVTQILDCNTKQQVYQLSRIEFTVSENRFHLKEGNTRKYLAEKELVKPACKRR